MAGFSLKRLFASVTLIAIGCGQMAFLDRHIPLNIDDPIIGIALWTCLPFVCAGFMTPSKNTLIGACIGFGITIIVTLCLPAVQ